MAKVEITVNGRAYTIGCEDGHEQRLMRLAERFDAEVTKLAERVGQIGDLRLFLMAGLVVSDALDEAVGGRRLVEQFGHGEEADEDRHEADPL